MESAKPNDLFQENKSTLGLEWSRSVINRLFSSACVALERAEKDRENHHNYSQRVTTEASTLWICINIQYSGYVFISMCQVIIPIVQRWKLSLCDVKWLAQGTQFGTQMLARCSSSISLFPSGHTARCHFQDHLSLDATIWLNLTSRKWVEVIKVISRPIKPDCTWLSLFLPNSQTERMPEEDIEEGGIWTWKNPGPSVSPWRRAPSSSLLLQLDSGVTRNNPLC